MQGLNRYIPPDYDPKKNSTLNSYQGKKHALGVRAKDIDKGILVVRFELPFNIWCGTCNAHIGAGVRYNARKQKVGNYYSSPIFAFRCKCHLCDGWFEIRTDPKNAAYVVHEGARKKDEDWDPEANGGFAVHDTEAPSASEPPIDPFAGVEKTIDQQKWAKRGTSRITELTSLSDRLSSDPYLISSALRRKFREEKKVMLDNQLRDESLKERFGLHEDIDLGTNRDMPEGDGEGNKAGEIWRVSRENRGLPVDDVKNGESSSRGLGSGSMTVPIARRNGKGKGKLGDNQHANLALVLRKNTGKKYNPFSDVSFSSPTSSSTSSTPVKLNTTGILDGVRNKGRIKDGVLTNLTPKQKPSDRSKDKVEKDESVHTLSPANGLGGGLLAGYDSD